MAAKKKATKKKAARKKKAAVNETKAPPCPWSWVDGAWCRNQSDAASFVGVSVPMFRRYELAPHARRGKSVYYAEADLLALVRKRQHERSFKEGAASQPTDLHDILARKEKAELEWTLEKAEGQRLKNKQTRREQAPVSMVGFAIGQFGSQVAAHLETIPGKIKRVLPQLRSSDLQVIKREIVKAQNIASEAELDWDEFDEQSVSVEGGDQ